MATAKDTPGNSLEWLKNKATAVAANAEQKAAETTKELFLPGFDLGAMPNHLNRSSFIAPIARGRRKFHRQTKMVSRSDCVLEYTGEQLDEADGDILMALLFFAQRHPLGTPVRLNRAELLRKLGRDTGKQQYEWLHRRIKAMTEGTIFIEARRPDGATRYRLGYSVAFHIIISFVYDDKTDTYSYILDPRWVQMGVLSRNRRKFRQPINVACPAPGRWGRPNSRVTSRHFDHGNASRTSRPDCSGLDEAD